MRKLDLMPMRTTAPGDGLPDDPRTRQVLRQLRETPENRILFGAPGSARSKSAEQKAWLYWILRIAQPERAWVAGCPAPDDLITLAAAVADGGGRQVVCLDKPGRLPGASVQGLVADAGLDWLLRFADLDSTPGFVPDALVFAGDDPATIMRAVKRFDLATGPKLVIGLGQAVAASGARGRALHDYLSARGFRILLPEAMPLAIWAALSRGGRG